MNPFQTMQPYDGPQSFDDIDPRQLKGIMGPVRRPFQAGNALPNFDDAGQWQPPFQTREAAGPVMNTLAADLMTGARTFAANAADPLHIPSWAAGQVSPFVRDEWRAMQQGPTEMQFAGAMAAPIGALGAAGKVALGAAPKAAAAGGAGLYGMLADVNTAGAQKTDKVPSNVKPATNEELTRAAYRQGDPMWDGVKGDPALEAKYEQLRLARERSTSKMAGVNAQGSNDARAAAAAEAERLSNEITQVLAKRNPPKLSFEQAFPALNEALPVIQVAAPAAIGAATKAIGAGKAAYAQRDLRKAIRDGNTALSDADKAGSAGEKAAALARAERASNVANEFQATKSAFNGFTNALAPAVGGGMAGGELALLPHQYNVRNAPEGSEAQRLAERVMSSPEAMMRTAGSSALLGAAGGFSGAKLMPFEAINPVAQTRALAANVTAARNPVTQPGGGPTGGTVLPPPTPPFEHVGKYRDISEAQRGDIRSVVMSHAAEDGLAQKGFARETVDRLVPGHEINKSDITRRQNATTKAIQEHAAQTGKSPQQFGEHDWAQIFNNKTLGLAGGAGIAASPFLQRDAVDY
jgi:hypothetical protein